MYNFFLIRNSWRKYTCEKCFKIGHAKNTKSQTEVKTLLSSNSQRNYKALLIFIMCREDSRNVKLFFHPSQKYTLSKIIKNLPSQPQRILNPK